MSYLERSSSFLKINKDTFSLGQREKMLLVLSTDGVTEKNTILLCSSKGKLVKLPRRWDYKECIETYKGTVVNLWGRVAI